MSDRQSVSRRSLLKKGAAAAVGGATLIAGGTALAAQASAQAGGDRGPNVAGRKFRAVVSTGFGPIVTG